MNVWQKKIKQMVSLSHIMFMKKYYLNLREGFIHNTIIRIGKQPFGM